VRGSWRGRSGDPSRGSRDRPGGSWGRERWYGDGVVLYLPSRELFDDRHPGVYYWPSFEIVRWAGVHLAWPAFGLDDDKTRHLTRRLVAEIVDAFVKTFFLPRR
jgi:hypothetical protein